MLCQGMGTGHGQKDILIVYVDVLIIGLVFLAERHKAQVQISFGDHGLLCLYTDFLRFYGDVGELLVELRVNAHKHADAALRRQAHGQPSHLIVRHIIQYVVGFLLQHKDLPRILHIDLPCFCKPQVILAAVEQLDAQFVFQL